MSSPALPTRDAIVATAQESIARGSKSFAAASKLFDRPVRERAWLLYAWCRACDDIADGQDHGHDMTGVDDGPARLAEISAKTEYALAGRVVGDPAFDALRIFAAETTLPPALARDLIAGFALDAEGWRPRTEADLYQYCYHVAGAVGCMMALAMGVAATDEATLDRACDLGIAFQLANIARDIAEDARAGRCYLPQDWLDEMGLRADTLLAPENRAPLGLLGVRLAHLAAGYEASARRGTPALSFRSAWAVLAAADIYGAIARGVASLGPRAWDDRVTTSSAAKLAMIGKAFFAASRRAQAYPPAPRDGALWTRPRNTEGRANHIR
ncbi:phytoene/squalene synthase family protein [Sphingomonas glacialis]|uniref:Phytoene/squalene synthase family protein n=1 Tax=Sphingomonas glacialis TaxID=658225 RepID=A0A502FT85_9SPHN|nr:phytoene/squalene synthase family protein [Sphingomonas glacialis]TPG52748.1 phytoene/squalene synthase family protein [Sphingomonas glacialis]